MKHVVVEEVGEDDWPVADEADGPLNHKKSPGYYASEFSWASSATDDAVDPGALMRLFEAHENIR